MRFRPDIEGLRAVAVAMVVLNHLGVRGFGGGFVGVDVFFVISGYLITGMLATEYANVRRTRGRHARISLTAFYLRRARRILPAGLAVIASVVAGAHYLLNSLRAAQVRHDAAWAAFFGSNVNFIRQANDYFATGLNTMSPFRHYWSLAVEEQFYFVWPLLFLLVAGLHRIARQRKQIGWQTRLTIAVSVLGCASLVWSIEDTRRNPASAYYSTFTRAWELALGAVLVLTSMAISGRARRFPSSLVSLVGLGFLAGSLVAITATSSFPGYLALLPTVGAALLICGGEAEPLPTLNRVLGLAPMRFVGRISYSLYLWHWPLIVFANALYPSESVTVTGRVMLGLGSVLVATVSYYLIERPFRRIDVDRLIDLMRERERQLRRSAELVSAVAAVALLAGVFVYASRWQHDDVLATPLASQNPLPRVVAHQTHSRRVAARSYDRRLASWQRSVKAGLTIRKVPASLTPLANHLLQVSVPCASYRLAIVEHESECLWGNPKARRVAAITGDSHAGMWLTTLERTLDPRDWKVYPFTRSWCGWSGTSEAIAAADRPKNKDCTQLQTQTIHELKRLHANLIILSEDLSRPENEMDSALAAFTALHATVVVIGQTPVVVPKFQSCLRGSSDISACNGTLTEENQTSVRLEATAASDYGATYIDTTPWFCYGVDCPATINGSAAFADGSHISADLAPKLSPLLATALTQYHAVPASTVQLP